MVKLEVTNIADDKSVLCIMHTPKGYVLKINNLRAIISSTNVNEIANALTTIAEIEVTSEKVVILSSSKSYSIKLEMKRSEGDTDGQIELSLSMGANSSCATISADDCLVFTQVLRNYVIPSVINEDGKLILKS